MSKVLTYSLQLCVVVLLSNTFALAQLGGAGLQEQLKALTGESQFSASDALTQMNGFQSAYDQVVQAETYLVGPGDILQVQLSGVIEQELPVRISPEGTVLLPRLGELKLRGLTLAEVKQLIETEVQANTNSEAFVTLLQPRTVYVEIDGNVPFPGMYAFPASMKVSTAVKLASQPKATSIARVQEKSAYQQETGRVQAQTRTSFTASYSRRHILVAHADGTSSIADEVRGRVRPNGKADPHLREGDHIFVPFEPETVSYISVSGEVGRPSVLAYRDGDNLALLMKAGFGLTANADPNKVYVIQPGLQPSFRTYQDILASGESQLIRPGTSIVVHRNEKEVNNASVAVSGHVQYPGTFVIEEGVTRLRDIIELAGGFTDQAYLPLAYIQRTDDAVSSAASTRDISLQLFQYSNLTIGDTARFAIDMLSRRPMVSCDFKAAFTGGSDEDNVLLQDGDVIVVPKNPSSVYVFGQVLKPGYVEFVPGKNLAWYVHRAGGPGSDADESRLSIIRGSNSVWIQDPEAEVFSGDQIYLPREAEYPLDQERASIAAYAGIVSAVANLTWIIYNVVQ